MIASTYRTLRTAARSLRRNVMRSVLTTLGIIIGVAAVICMMEIGSGAQSSIQSRIASMGANTLLVMPGNAAAGGISFGFGSSLTLTPQDCEAVLRDCPAIKSATPIVRANCQVIYGNKNYLPNTIQGSSPAFLDVRDWTTMEEGEAFTDHDVLTGNTVCLVGLTVVRELFNGKSPIGKTVRMNNVSFKVIGVLSSKGANMMGQDQDDIVLAPWTAIKFRVSNSTSSSTAAAAAASNTTSTVTSTAGQLFPTAEPIYAAPSTVEQADTPQPIKFANVNQILCSAVSADQIQPAIDQITDLLHERHHIRPGQLDDFNIRNMTEMTDMLSSTSTIMTNLLLGVALISLVVGGVGIMNIMLVSVTERTREIGLRMAVGARGGDILRQFLIEAVVLCLMGGLFGIVLGRGGSMIIQAVLHWPTKPSLPAILAAVLVSATTGIIFGYYPAWKASRLDPIEALRYE